MMMAVGESLSQRIDDDITNYRDGTKGGMARAAVFVSSAIVMGLFLI